jgi:hypothetical protein
MWHQIGYADACIETLTDHIDQPSIRYYIEADRRIAPHILGKNGVKYAARRAQRGIDAQAARHALLTAACIGHRMMDIR